MMIGLTVMIFSFRQSVGAWVERGIVADLFIAPASNEIVGLGASVPPAALAWLRAQPEVAAVDTFREQPVRLGRTRAIDALLAVVGGEYRRNLSFVGGDVNGRLRRVFGGEGAVAVTERFARRFRVREGDGSRSDAEQGRRRFPDRRGLRGLHARPWRDAHGAARRSIDSGARRRLSLAVFLAPERRRGGAGRRVSRSSSAGRASSRSTRIARFASASFSIFDQTFAVTYVLRTVAFFVAIAGIFLSVTTLVAERERETSACCARSALRAGKSVRLFMVESGHDRPGRQRARPRSRARAGGGADVGGESGVLRLEHRLHFPWAALATTPLWIAAAPRSPPPSRRGSRARGRIAEAVRDE